MALLEDSLIAHYKMNENAAGDNAELVTNGDFSAWTADNPDGWTVSGESGADPEVSEVGTGEGHGGVGTGMCNLYTSDGTFVRIRQDITTLVVGRKYRGSITVDTITVGNISVSDISHTMWTPFMPLTGITYWEFVATHTDITLEVKRTGGATDVTFDDISTKLCAIEDSSGNDHDGLAQQDSDAISVAGKNNTALEFNGSSDYIIIPDHDDFTPALTPFSISAWVNMDDVTDFFIASKGVYNTDSEWRFRTASSKLRFQLFDESIDDCSIGRGYNTVLTAYANQWIHVVATYGGGAVSSSVKLYLNSIRVDDVNVQNAVFVSVENLTGDVWIGRDIGQYSNGTIDNVMFFNKELTALEVQLLYNSGAGVENIPTGIDLSRTGQNFSSSQMN